MIRLLLFLLPLLLGAKEFNLLVIHSYSSQYAWTEGQAHGFIETLKNAPEHKFNIKTEYLDTKRVEICSEYTERYRAFLAFKYQNFHPDAIYTTDDNALRFVLRLKKEYYHTVPVFFSGVNQTNLGLDKKMYAGVFEKKEIPKNLSLIQELFPDNQKILVIGDNSTTYSIIKKQIESHAKTMPQLQIDYAESDSISKLTETVLKHPDHILLLTTLGNIKNDGLNELSLRQSIPMLEAATDQPVFSMEDVYMLPEVFGGFATRSYTQGELAAEMLLAYISGKPPASIPNILEGTSRYLFSQPQLERFRISLPDAIEESAVILYQAPSLFQEHEELFYLLLVILLILIFAGLLLFALFILRKNRTISRYAKAVERSEKKLRDMFDQHTAVMLLIDPKTSRIIDANDAAAKFYGYDVKQLEQMMITDLNQLSETDVKRHETDAETKKNNYFIFKHRLANGDIRDVEVYSTPIQTGEGTLLFSIVHDITEVVAYRNNLEARVAEEIDKRQRHEQLMVQQSRQAAMGEMINAIAHQWRQPLNALGIFIQDLEDAYEFNELNAEYIQNMIEHSMSQIHFMSKTIDDFRDFFRPDKHKSEFSAKAVIEEVLGLLKAQLHTHHIALTLEGEDFTLHNYSNEFKQVILNIVNNAKDAILEAKGKSTAVPGKEYAISITLTQTQDKPTVLIKDNAGGISDNVLPRIFEPYFTTKEQGKGTGIGLYLVKTIVEEHMNGSIHAQNRDGGACFTIIFNQKDEE